MKTFDDRIKALLDQIVEDAVKHNSQEYRITKYTYHMASTLRNEMLGIDKAKPLPERFSE